MTRPDSSVPPARAPQPFEPGRPTLIALGWFMLWMGILSLPMWTGKFLGGPWSDQYATGYGFRAWLARHWMASGEIPLWNPEIFGGLPFVAAMHGDIFYPTAWLRNGLPVWLAMDLGFVIHYVLAGLFLYLLLRLLGVSWTGSVTGGLAYQLSGVIVSYVSPGHDGKLYVSTLLPLALIALVLALRRRRAEGYPLLALTIGLALLSPHYQMVYYLLIVAGLFALYLTAGEGERKSWAERSRDLGLALVAVGVGFGIAMIQVLPFLEYLPFSPRAQGYGGFVHSASYAIPWAHVPEFFLPGFVGDRAAYWGPNPLKLHSEYLGLPVVALAVLGALGRRRRLTYWLLGIGGLLLLVALGGATPFYRVWWAVMPFVKQTRAPGMAFYCVSLVVAMLAAFGAERVEVGEGRRHVLVWLAAGAAVVVLAVVGAVTGAAAVLAEGADGVAGQAVRQLRGAEPAITWGAAWSGTALVAVALLALARLRRVIPLGVFCLTLPLLVGADLWRNGRSFWTFTRVHEELFGTDPLTERLLATPRPYRVLQLPGAEIYPGSALMAFDVAQLLGHHGNELHRFDELLGGRNRWDHLGSLRLWDLYAVSHVLLPAGSGVAERSPEFSRRFTSLLTDVRTSAGTPADLFVRREPVHYARLVPAALEAPDNEAIPIIVDPDSRFDPDRIVLLAPDAAHESAPVSSLPDTLPVAASFEEWRPGWMSVRLSPPAPQEAYLLISENWYPGWRATVDGEPAPVLRGNVSMVTVPVPAGAERVIVRFDSPAYRRGRAISFLSLALVTLGLVIPAFQRGRARG